MRNELSPKILKIVFIAAVIFCGSFYVHVIQQYQENKISQAMNNGMKLEFKTDGPVTFEYGDQIKPLELIKVYKGDLKYPKINTKKIGKTTYTYKVSYDDIEKEYNKEIIIKDTKAPKIDAKKGTKFTVYKGEKIPYTHEDFVASDPIDGPLSLEMDGYVNTNAVGRYVLNVSAKDCNDNKTMKNIEVIVQEREPKCLLDYSTETDFNHYTRIDANSISIRGTILHHDLNISEDILDSYIYYIQACPRFLLNSIKDIYLLNNSEMQPYIEKKQGFVTEYGISLPNDHALLLYETDRTQEECIVYLSLLNFNKQYKLTDSKTYQELFENLSNDHPQMTKEECFAYVGSQYITANTDALEQEFFPILDWFKEIQL